jgi:ATP-dependent Clp protease ATP-binding subunit ClpA
MFDRFTDRARRVLGSSRHECQRFRHDSIGPEHILLGLVDERSGPASDVLSNLGIDRSRIRQETERKLSMGSTAATMGPVLFTPGAKRVLELAVEEARDFGHNYIGTEHLLLGLIREKKGIAADVLRDLNVRLEDVRAKVREHLAAQERHGAQPEPQGHDPLSGRARRAMNLAWQEAQRLRHERIGPEHILLGLLEEEIRIGPELSRVLLLHLRAEMEKAITPGTVPVAKGTPLFTPEGKSVLERALQEAHDLGHARVATPHLFLGLFGEEGVPARILSDAGIQREDVLSEAGRLHGEETSGGPGGAG